MGNRLGIVLTLVGSLAAPAVSAFEPLVDLDFGPRGFTDGTVILWGVGAREPRMGWTGGRVVDFIDRNQRHPGLRDGIAGSDAIFSIGVWPPDSLYRLTLYLGDQVRQPGPISIYIDTALVAEGITALADTRRELQFLVNPAGDRVSFRLKAGPCEQFAIAGARLEGPAGARLVAIFPEGDPSFGPIPPVDSLLTIDRAGLQRQLRRDAEFLMEERLSDKRFSLHGAWYQNSFPIRALLSADELLDEPAWRDAAFELLDDFVAGQLPNGNWHAAYDSRHGCSSAPGDTASANLADIGSMTLALALAVPRAEEPRRSRYRSALVRYADSISLPNQLPDGGFMNRTWQNKDYRFPYSVATGTQISTLVVLHQITGDDRYRTAAGVAAKWLARQVRDDGRIAFAPHDRATTQLVGSTRFGDIYYMMEALMFVAGWTTDDALRREVDLAFDRWVEGPVGLRVLARNGYWWPMGDLWTDSKLAGVPALLCERLRRPAPESLREMVHRQLSWLDDDRLSRRIGVRASPAAMSGEYGLVATGFAGLSAAAGLKFVLGLNSTGRPHGGARGDGE